MTASLFFRFVPLRWPGSGLLFRSIAAYKHTITTITDDDGGRRCSGATLIVDWVDWASEGAPPFRCVTTSVVRGWFSWLRSWFGEAVSLCGDRRSPPTPSRCHLFGLGQEFVRGIGKGIMSSAFSDLVIVCDSGSGLCLKSSEPRICGSKVSGRAPEWMDFIHDFLLGEEKFWK